MRRRLRARLTLDDADDVELELLGKVREGLVERHDVLVRQVVKLLVHLFAQGRELRDVVERVLAVGIGVLRVGLAELRGDGLDLLDTVGHAEPDVRVDLIAVLEEVDLIRLRGIDDLEVLLLLDDLVEEALHARAVDDEGVGLLERLHVLRRQLVIMQAARLRLRHVDDLDAVDTLRDVDGIDVHRVERSDDAELLVVAALLLRAAASRCERHQHEQHSHKDFFQKDSPFSSANFIEISSQL